MEITTLEEVERLLGGSKFPGCDSASLRLEKYVRLGDNTKKEEIDEVVKKSSYLIPPVLPKGARYLVAKLDSHLIVNQAGGVLENAGMCLHPHFGSPYVPGSAVKGCARHAAWCAWNEMDEGPQREALANEIARLFGYPTNDESLDGYLAMRGWKDRRTSGAVGFFAAVPVSSARLVTDIVNCHHPAYYRNDGSKPYAADDESPNPQFFPAVREGADFLFAVAPLRGDEGDAEKALKWVQAAIEEQGIGAKTAAGYGVFLRDDAAKDQWLKRLERERQQRDAEIAFRNVEKKLVELEAEYGGDESVEPGERSAKLSGELKSLRAAIADFSVERVELLRPRINRLDKLLPQLSPFDAAMTEWRSKPAEACVLHRFFLEFGDDKIVSNSIREQVVEMLRSSEDPGAKIWKYLRDDGAINQIRKDKTKKKVRIAVQKIREFAKKTPKGALK